MIRENFHRQLGGLATPPNTCPNGSRNPSLLSSTTSENELGADLTVPLDSSEATSPGLSFSLDLPEGGDPSIHINSSEVTSPGLSFSFDLPEGGDPSIHVKSRKPSSTEDGPENGEDGDPMALGEPENTLEDEDDPMAEVGAATSKAALEDGDDPMAEVVAITSEATLEDGDDPMVALSEDGGDPSIHVKSKKPSSTEEGPGNGVEGDPVAEQEDDPMDAVVVSSKDALSESIRDGESCPTVDASSDSTEDEDAVPKVAVESKKQFHSSEDGKQGGPVLPKEPLPSPRYIQATTHWPEGFRKRPDAINSGDEGDSDSSATIGDELHQEGVLG